MQKHIYIIASSDAGKRLDSFLATHLADISREKIKRAIQNGNCFINAIVEKNPATRLQIGQNIEFSLNAAQENLIPENGEVDIIWHDEHIAICNKQAGITVHPCPSCTSGTYIQRLASHFPSLLLQEGLRPGIVHRLDKDTSGLMVIALNEGARLCLSDDFANRNVQKSYLALVHGVIPEHGEIKDPIGRHPHIKVKMAIVEEKYGGREAHSIWKRLYADEQKRFSLVEVKILTGRTHQIRVHMAHLGFPLWGDQVYGRKQNLANLDYVAKRQMLHAWKLCLTHPVSKNKLSFCVTPPDDMLECALQLSNNLQKIIIVGLPGCGKSTLLEKFQLQGIPTFSADATVKKLYAPGAAGHNYFLSRFGTMVVAHPKAEVNREALRSIMKDNNIRQEINNYIHSLVYDEAQLFWNNCQNNGSKFAVAEIPLYLENGRHHVEEAYIIGIECDQSTRYARMQCNRQWTEEQCHNMDSWQWSEPKKMSACHDVINNSKNPEKLDNYVLKTLEKLKKIHYEKKIHLSNHLQKLWQQVS